MPETNWMWDETPILPDMCCVCGRETEIRSGHVIKRTSMFIPFVGGWIGSQEESGMVLPFCLKHLIIKKVLENLPGFLLIMGAISLALDPVSMFIFGEVSRLSAWGFLIGLPGGIILWPVLGVVKRLFMHIYFERTGATTLIVPSREFIDHIRIIPRTQPDSASKPVSEAAAQKKKPVKKDLDICSLARDNRIGKVKALLMEEPGLVQYKLNQKQETPLHFAAFEGHAEMVGILLKAGAVVDAWDCFRAAPLLKAAMNGHTEVMAELIRHGAKVNSKADENVTALLMAAINGHADAVKLLLEHGADPGIRDLIGASPLDMAREEGHEAVIRILEDKTGDAL